MKQRRRKELKSNELSQYLLELYEFATRNVNYIIGAVVIVILVLGIGWVIRGNRARQLHVAWNECTELQAVKTVDQSHLDRAESLVSGYGEHGDLGPTVLALQADLLYQRALSLPAEADRQQRIALLSKAKKTLELSLARFSHRREVVAEARIRLAPIEETLLLAGQGDKAVIRKLYQQLIDDKANPFATVAERLLNDLDARLTKLDIVATRPAEELATRPATRPATQPAVSRPGPATIPATTAPAAR